MLTLSLLLFIAQPFSFTTTVYAQPDSPKIVGDWVGSIEIPGQLLRVVLHIKGADPKSLTATADSPDQNANGMHVDSITFVKGALKFEMKALKATYLGKMTGEAIKGTFTQAGTPLTLNFKRLTSPIVVGKPQDPKKPYPYSEREVNYKNPKSGFDIAGTLTFPKGKEKFPVAIMITGSGAQDRNEALLGHRPFLVIADYLTRRGIAVLRVDDRGVGGSGGSTPNSTSADFATDVDAGINFLKKQPEIDPTRIGLIGHSEGGLIGPLVASRSSDVAFVVMMAGPGLPGEQILYLQGDAIMKANGANQADIDSNKRVQKMMFDIVKSDLSKVNAEKKMMEGWVHIRETLPIQKQNNPEYSDKAAKAQIQGVLSPWMRYFIKHDPRPALCKVKCPILAINGSKDLQVPVKEDLDEIRAAFKESENPDATALELPNLNHLFQTCQTGSPTEYATIQETISPLALQTIGDWIVKRMLLGK